MQIVDNHKTLFKTLEHLDKSCLVVNGKSETEIVSGQAAVRALLLLAEGEKIRITVSEQVITEVERNIARKAPKALLFSRELIRVANIQIVRDPQPEDVLLHLDWISHASVVSILVAAASSRVKFFTTLNSRDFLVDPQVVNRSGLRISMPGDAFTRVRKQLSKKIE